jgi:hypothetical protein
MFIALGLIGALWIAGMWIWPDKNATPAAHAAAPAAASSEASPSPTQR